jgi:RAB protein geranylgeranyltransferase component A
MDTLDNSDWDVLIVGTGLQQSLLALYVASLASQSPSAI